LPAVSRLADVPPPKARPPCDVAVRDGWALASGDLVGASSYSPLPLSAAPRWVDAGEALPSGCDCVVDADCVDQAGPAFQVVAEARPGEGVRRKGEDIAEGSSLGDFISGRWIRPLDLLLARLAGFDRLRVRRPRLRIIDIPASSGEMATAQLITETARAAGTHTICARAAGRDRQSVASALESGDCDMLITIGGSGVGRSDATIAALAGRGEVVAHGLALQPGRTAAIGRIGKIPVMALPGAPDQALAAWWTLALPVLDRLSGRQPRITVKLPLARKIASSVGLAEIVLLEKADRGWMPLAVGDLSLQALARADAWMVVAGGSEGFAAGEPVDAYMLRD